MKSSKFSPTQISKILQEFESGKDIMLLLENMELVKLRFISGVNATVVWKQVN